MNLNTLILNERGLLKSVHTTHAQMEVVGKIKCEKFPEAKETFGLMDKFIIFIVVMLHGCMYMSKFIKLVQFRVCQLYMNKAV